MDRNQPFAAATIETCSTKSLTDWATLRAEFWPDGTAAEHQHFCSAALSDPGRFATFLARSYDGSPVGFAEATLRSDYVNGCSTSPVAFLEGLYVQEKARRLGIARELVAAIERWAVERGCSELASDALLENARSHDAHRGMGFEETERVVYFLKMLSEPKGSGTQVAGPPRMN